MLMVYRIDDIYFALNEYEFSHGKLEYSAEPSEMSTINTIDSGFPTISLRDPRTVVHIFSIEVEIASYDYKKLLKLANDQFFKVEPKYRKIKRLVFNDCIGFKLVSNNALFKEIPSRSYVSSAEKATFVVHTTNAEIITKDNE